jgi:hypothetical protein
MRVTTVATAARPRWKALEKQGKTADAAAVRTSFEAAWQGADVTLRMDPL